jgi:multiple sugar transport system permease protein
MRRSLTAWWFVAPALIVIGVFFVLPVLAALLISFTDFDLYALADLRNLRFVHVRNYVRFAGNTPVLAGARQHALFRGGGVPLSIAASLAAALLVDSPLARFRSFFRTALFTPVVTTLVAVAVIWRYLLSTRYGMINFALAQLGIGPIDWLGDPHWAMPAIILFAVWKSFGYNMVILLAGLQSIPRELYEAARVDGASALQRFGQITLPMLAPILAVVSILTVAGYFQLFAEPYVMTQGGPLQSTVSVLYFMYEEGFKWWNLGSASAVAFLLFLLIFALTCVAAARVAARRRRRMRKLAAPVAVNGLLATLAAITLFPLVWMLAVSLMTPGEASAYPPPLLAAQRDACQLSRAVRARGHAALRAQQHRARGRP